MPDLRTLSISRFCNFVWWWTTHKVEKQADVDDFKARLWIPPKGEVAQGPWSAEAETSAFAAFKSGLTGSGS